jgi:hypothetical protein
MTNAVVENLPDQTAWPVGDGALISTGVSPELDREKLR